MMAKAKPCSYEVDPGCGSQLPLESLMSFVVYPTTITPQVDKPNYNPDAWSSTSENLLCL